MGGFSKHFFCKHRCGIGSPWGTTKGIVATGLAGYSPYFRMFKVKRRQDVHFSCDFIICTSNCDGVSIYAYTKIGLE